jgi:hypothetical protein
LNKKFVLREDKKWGRVLKCSGGKTRALSFSTQELLSEIDSFPPYSTQKRVEKSDRK